MNAEQFGVRVRERRSQEGLSQEELAQKTGISRNYLSQIERGQAENISLDYIQRLVTVLGMDLRIAKEGLRDSSSETLPESLREFAEQDEVPDGDVAMLAQLNYRGKRPQTAPEWRVLYKVIKSVLE